MNSGQFKISQRFKRWTGVEQTLFLVGYKIFLLSSKEKKKVRITGSNAIPQESSGKVFIIHFGDTEVAKGSISMSTNGNAVQRAKQSLYRRFRLAAHRQTNQAGN